LPQIALNGSQNGNPLLDQLLRRQRFVTGALQADKLSNVFEILAEYILATARDDGHVAHAKREQLLASARIVQHIDGDKVDIFFRKKLFRSEAATSSGLRK
jgi:hypothetical protein